MNSLHSPSHYVIIGNGAAANKAAAVIRKRDKESRVTLISNEFFPYYYRHRLCAYLTGELREHELAVIPAETYKRKNIRLRLGQEVVKIDFSAKTIYLKHMEKIHYDKLLIACGGRPRVPEPLHALRRHFSFLKTLADARHWKARLPEVDTVLMVGGDLVGTKITRALAAMGKRVVFMVDRASFWPLDLKDEQHREFVGALRAAGVEVLEDGVRDITPEDGAYLVTTREGGRVKAGLIGAFFGLTPDIGFLAGSGIDMERGIIVNEHLETSVEDVYAAGDCAQIYNPDLRDYWVSMGWHNAKRLGVLAGENMAGAKGSTGVPKGALFTMGTLKVRTSWWKEL